MGRFSRFGRLLLIVSTLFGIVPLVAATPAAAWSPDNWQTPGPYYFAYPRMGSVDAAVSASGDGVAVFDVSVDLGGGFLQGNVAAVLWDGAKWGAPVTILPTAPVVEQGGGSAVGMDANGSAIAVWRQDAYPTPNAGWASHASGQPGWVYHGTFADNASAGIIDIAFAMADNGTAHALWSADQGSGSYALRDQMYEPGVGWSASEVVAYTDTYIRWPAVGLDANGTAFAAWVDGMPGGSTDSTMMVSVKPAGGAWSPATPLSNTTGYIEKSPSLAVSASGDAFVAWYENTPAGSYTYFTRWSTSGGWQNATLVTSGVPYTSPVLTADANGGAAIVYGTGSTAYLSLFSPSTGLQAVGALPSRAGTEAAGGAGAGFDKYGTLRIVWTTQASSTSSVLAVEYRPGSGLGFSDVVDLTPVWTNQQETVADLSVAVSAEGPMVAAMVGQAVEQVYDPFGDPAGEVYFGGYLAAMPWDRTPPPLSVASPANGSQADRSLVWVSGITDPEAQLTVAGFPASVDAQGAFGVAVPLVDGSNALELVARDLNRNEARLVLTVDYSDPDARRNEQLEAALSAQNATLLAQLAQTNASLLAQLASQNDTLISLIAQTNMTLLAKLASENSALDARIAATNASLSAQLQTLQGDLAATDDRGAETSADLTAAEARAAALSGQVGTLSVVAALALLAAVGSAGWNVLQSRKRERARQAAELARKKKRREL